MTKTIRDSDERSGILVPLLLGLLMLLMLWTTALAQAVDADKAPSTAPAASEPAARGQRPAIREMRFGEWRKVCFKPGGAAMVCRTSLIGAWETKQQALRVDLIEREGEPAARLQLFLPVGLHLPSGVMLSIDQTTNYRIPFVWCLTNLCIAADLAAPTLLHALEGGNLLSLEVVDANLLTVRTDLPLARFADVRHGPPIQIFEQDIEE